LPDANPHPDLDPSWLEVLRVLRLRGPNIWTNHPVLEVWVDLHDMMDTGSDEVPGFNDRLMAWLPSMIEHRCSEGVRGGFFERLRRGTYPAHILEHVTLELQSLAGTPAGFGKARVTSDERIYRVILRYEVEDVALAALDSARALLFAAYKGLPFDLDAELARLRDLVQKTRLDPGGRALVEAASERLIPARRLGREGLIVLGQGARQRRVSASATDQTSAVGESIASDRGLAYELLRNVGVPVPENRRVHSAEEAWDEAQDLGFPVVLKPRDS
jgi:cyanophycin synthetase